MFFSSSSSTTSFPAMPSTASEFFAAYASLTGTIMLVRSMANQLIPNPVRSYLHSKLQYWFTLTPLSSTLTLTIDQTAGFTRNQIYDAAETYLRTKISPSSGRLKVSKTPRQKQIMVGIVKGEEITDEFDGVKIKWRFVHSEGNQNAPNSREKKFFELAFDKKFKQKILDSYLPEVLVKAKEIKEGEKVVKLYTRGQSGSYDEEGGPPQHHGGWGSINLEHPSTFDTLAMDPEMKKAIVDDLERFVRRKEFYKKVGKAWKRGYLLYGPPGTGKSSLIAAIANYLKFDIYDLELSSLHSNSDLRRVLLATTNRSVLVIEDIDCTAEVRDRQYGGNFGSPNTKLTLSGLLNFVDGLWSSCGDERIIIFTTNHKDKLDPALLRPGRMDMHIHMSYCTPSGFKLLASNYLGLNGSHQLFGEIENLIENTEVTPAEIAEELMKSDDGDVALGGLVNFLKRKSMECNEPKNEEGEKIELVDSKRQKMADSINITADIIPRNINGGYPLSGMQ